MSAEFPGLSITPLGWLEGAGPADIALATRIRLSRNLSGFPFVGPEANQALEGIEVMLAGKLLSFAGTPFSAYCNFDTLPYLTRMGLVERLIIPVEFVHAPQRRGLALSSDCRWCSLVNCEDHVSISYTLPGLAADNAWHAIEALDDQIGNMVEYAFDPDFGFLTTNARDVGTGMRLSALLHLPALVLAEQIDKAEAACNEIGFSLESLYGETVVGHLYRVSNARTIGMSEADIVSAFNRCVPALLQYEIRARESLMKPKHRTFLEDRIARASGLIGSARLIEAEEVLDLLSVIRLGAALGLLPVKAGNLFIELFFAVHDSHMQAEFGRELSDDERETRRGEFVRSALNTALSS